MKNCHRHLDAIHPIFLSPL